MSISRMFRAAAATGIVWCAFLAAPSPALAATISIFNTGVGPTGTPLVAGSVDSHYLQIAPTGSAFVLGSPAGSWVVNNLISEWIGPDTGDGSSISGGVYTLTYRQQFSLAGLNPATAQLSGQWAADNLGQLFLNGVLQSSTPGFSAFTPFSITSNFVAGVNDLDFVWTNQGGPGGLRAEVTGTATPSDTQTPVPEPATMTLLATGIGTLLAKRRRQRSS